MKSLRPLFVLAAFAALAAARCMAQVELPYDVKTDLQYSQAKDKPLFLDIFVPNGKGRFPYLKPNDNGKGLGLIDIISGGWNDHRARQEEHEKAGVFKILCARGYTIFAIRPGSVSEFTALEMVDNLKQGIRWVKAHAQEYGIDPDRLGLFGASAGGHLSLLTMLSVSPGDPNASDPLQRFDTSVKAVAAFFPPTDFMNWGGKPADPKREPGLIYTEGLEGKSQEQIDAAMRRISPALQIKGKTAPLFLIHGDADPIVPLQQSQLMVEAMKAAGNEATLYVKSGGGHFWLTIPEEIIMIGDWLDKKLAKS